MGGRAAPSPYTGNSVCSHPCCRWDQRQLGKGPWTDLNQLIRITNYTLLHTHMLRWWRLKDGVVAVPTVPLKGVVGLYCVVPTSWLFILSCHSCHFFLLLSQYAGVILHLSVGVIQPVTWREISGVTGKWIFHCNRLKSILPSIETHQQAWIALSALSAFLCDEITF